MDPEQSQTLPLPIRERIAFFRLTEKPRAKKLYKLMSINRALSKMVMQSSDQKLYKLIPQVIVNAMAVEDGNAAFLHWILNQRELVDWESVSARPGFVLGARDFLGMFQNQILKAPEGSLDFQNIKRYFQTLLEKEHEINRIVAETRQKGLHIPEIEDATFDVMKYLSNRYLDEDLSPFLKSKPIMAAMSNHNLEKLVKFMTEVYDQPSVISIMQSPELLHRISPENSRALFMDLASGGGGTLMGHLLEIQGFKERIPNDFYGEAAQIAASNGREDILEVLFSKPEYVQKIGSHQITQGIMSALDMEYADLLGHYLNSPGVMEKVEPHDLARIMERTAGLSLTHVHQVLSNGESLQELISRVHLPLPIAGLHL